MNNSINQKFSWRKGRQVEARYLKSPVPLYRDNPMDECLPPIPSRRVVIKRLSYYPEYSPSERELPVEVRMHCPDAIGQIIQPSTMMIRVENTFSRIIRTGYSYRNPFRKGFWQDHNRKIDQVEAGEYQNIYIPSNVNGVAICGDSGMGKSTAVNVTLNLYPQVVQHSQYHNQPFPFTQVVWLKIDCPGDASIRGLFLNIFRALDDILATNYYHDYARNGSATMDALVPRIACVADAHCIGVLVIDEASNLCDANIGGERRLLNYLVQVENIVGVPIVLIGTGMLLPLLGKNDFRQARRMTGEGDLIWKRMEKDGDWDNLLLTLFRYQYTKKICRLTPELSDVLYDLSQGITDVAVKIYKGAQTLAVENDDEKITVCTFRSAYQRLSRLKKPLSAIRNKDYDSLRQYDDLYLEWYNRIENHSNGNGNPIALPPDGQKDPSENHPVSTSVGSSENTPTQPLTIQPRQALKTRSKKRAKVIPTNSLMGIIARGREQKLSAYEALHNSGMIKVGP